MVFATWIDIMGFLVSDSDAQRIKDKIHDEMLDVYRLLLSDSMNAVDG